MILGMLSWARDGCHRQADKSGCRRSCSGDGWLFNFGPVSRSVTVGANFGCSLVWSTTWLAICGTELTGDGRRSSVGKLAVPDGSYDGLDFH